MVRLSIKFTNNVRRVYFSMRPLINDWILVCTLMIACVFLTDEFREWSNLLIQSGLCIIFAFGFVVIIEKWQMYWWLFVELAWWLSHAIVTRMVPINLCVIFGLGYIFWSWRRLVFVSEHIKQKILSQSNLNVDAKQVITYGRYLMLHEIVDKSDRINFELQQINEGNAQLIEVISHDLRAPQVTIMCLVDMFKQHDLDNETTRMLDEIKASATKTLKMTDEVLDFSHVNGGDLDLFDTDLVEVIETSLKVVQAQARSKNIIIRVQNRASPQLWMVGNVGLLESAFINFLTNAVRYSDKGTEIKLRLSTRQAESGHDWVDISIKDHGVGMSSELVTQLLTRGKLKRDQSSTPDAAGSRGMGFRIAQTIIQRHCGHLEVKSELGAGTEIVMSFPLS